MASTEVPVRESGNNDPVWFVKTSLQYCSPTSTCQVHMVNPAISSLNEPLFARETVPPVAFSAFGLVLHAWMETRPLEMVMIDISLHTEEVRV